MAICPIELSIKSGENILSQMTSLASYFSAIVKWLIQTLLSKKTFVETR